MVAFWASKLRDILMGPLGRCHLAAPVEDLSTIKTSLDEEASADRPTGPRVITSYKGGVTACHGGVSSPKW